MSLSLGAGGAHCHSALSKVKQQQWSLHLTCATFQKMKFCSFSASPHPFVQSPASLLAPLLPFLYLQCPKVYRIYITAPQGVILAKAYGSKIGFQLYKNERLGERSVHLIFEGWRDGFLEKR